MRAHRPRLRLALTVLALGTLVAGSILLPDPTGASLAALFGAALLVAALANLPVPLAAVEADLVHTVGLGLLFAFGPVSAGTALVAGAVLGEATRTLFPESGVARSKLTKVRWDALGIQIRRQLLPLIAGVAVYTWLGGAYPLRDAASANSLAAGVQALTLASAYMLLLALDTDAARNLPAFWSRANLLQIGLLVLLPMPVALFAAAGFDQLGWTLLVLLGGGAVVIAASLHALGRAQRRLKRQLLDNRRQVAETQRHIDEVGRLLELSSQLGATLSTEEALTLICPSAMRILSASSAALYMLDTDRAALALAHASGMKPAFARQHNLIPITTDPGGGALIAGPPRLVSDVRAEAQEAPAGWGETLEAAGLRAFVRLPLLARGEPLGAVVAFFEHAPKLMPWTMDVLGAFGNQAALSIANTRLYERTEEALARRVQRLAALASISHELTATLDLQPLFDMFTRRAVDATHATVGRLGIADARGHGVNFVAAHGRLLPSVEPERNGASLPPHTAEVIQQVMLTGQSAIIDDVRTEGAYVHSEPDGLRSQLCVPIVREGRQLGVILLESQAAAAFTADDQEFVEQLAVHAAIAIENARLYSEAQARLREQSILHSAGVTLASSLDRRAIHTAVAQQLAEVVGADESSLLDYDPNTGVLRTAWQWAPPGQAPRIPMQAFTPEDRPALARVLRDRAPLMARVSDPEGDDRAMAQLRAAGYEVLLALPMVAADQAVGVVELYSEAPREYDEAEVRLAQTLANQAAIAMENSRLFHRVMEGRDRLVAVLNSTREGVLVVDATGTVSLVNPRLEEFWAIPAGQLLGKNLVALGDDPDLDLADKLGFQPDEISELLQTLRAGLALSIPKVQFGLSQPRERFLERAGAPVLDQLGKAIGWVITLRDVTEERELQEVREALANMIVHDLRSPLTAVLTSVSMIAERLPREQQTPIVAQALEVSTRSSKKLLGLVNNLLDISRMESGQVVLQRSAAQLTDLVEEVVTDLMPIANENSIFLINEVPRDLLEVWVDREKIVRVLTNLIDNALKFTPAGGRVSVCGQALPPARAGVAPLVQCAVLDTGPGIPPEYRERIFDRFVTVHGRHGRRQGTGLGLAFCKLTVEAHGGKIWAENRAESGSAFHFLLPTARESAG